MSHTVADIAPAPACAAANGQESIADCPYVGLVPFSDTDAQRFFGRDTERRIIIDNLKASRLTLVYGASGVGKSSVLRAGVLHHLRLLSEQNMSDLGTPKFVAVYFNSWKEDPVLALKMSVQDTVRPWVAERPLVSSASETSLAQVLRVCSERANATLLVVLDQFEEYFLYHSSPGEKSPFDVELAQAANEPGLHANFVISMREDMLAQLDRLKGKIPNILGNYLRIDHLDREAARSAIEKPLQWFNTQPAARGRNFMVEPELVRAVLQQVTTGQVMLGDTGGGVVASSATASEFSLIETPFLQLVMTRLWEEECVAKSTTLRLSTLNRLGGAAEIADKYLDQALGDLSADEQRIVAAIFYYLVTPSGLKIAQTVSDLAALANVSRDQLAPVLEKLSRRCRILRSVDALPGSSGDARYQIFHDVLAPAVLAWRAKYVKAQELRDSEERAEEQHRRAEKEARAAKHLRWISVGLILCLIATAFTAWLAGKFGMRAHQQAQLNFARELDAAATSNLQWDPQLSLLLALQAVSVLHTAHEDKPLPAYSRDALSQAVEASRQTFEMRLDNPAAKMLDADYSPDGSRIVTAADDGTAYVWDASSGKRLFVLVGDKVGIERAIFGPGGKYIATLSFNGIVRLYTSSGTSLGAVPEDNGSQTLQVAFTPDESQLVIVRLRPKASSAIEFQDISQGTLGKKTTYPIASEFIRQFGDSIAISSDGSRMAFGGTGHVGVILQFHPYKVFMLSGHKGTIYSIAFSPDGQRLATGSTDGTAKLWDVHTGAMLMDLRGHTNTVFRVAFDSANPSRVATASADGTARIWDIATGKPVMILTGHKNAVNSVAFSPDGGRIVTASWDGTAILWDTPSFHSGPVTSVAFSHERMASSGQDGTARIWDASRFPPRSLFMLPETSDGMTSVAFSPDGSRIAVSGANGWARVFDSSGKLLFSLQGFSRDVNGIAFNPQGDRIVTAHDDGNNDGSVRVWDASSGTSVFKISRYQGAVTSAIFSPDGQHLATAGADQIVRLWDTSGNPSPGPGAKQFVRQMQDQVMGLAFSPNGRYLVASTLGGTVEVFDLVAGRDFQLIGHRMAVPTVAFDKDGKYVATASWDRTVRVWNLHTHTTTLVFTHPRGVESVAFSADGKYLATGCDDGVVRLFPLNDNELLAEARARVTRSLTADECHQYMHSDQCPVEP
ncbi:MAG TPA: hypothetical protein VMD92_00650 [Acidobacteriaceae bacterium]|nr:hypothetical protein [Acidobacteriaceae bacterium]